MATESTPVPHRDISMRDAFTLALRSWPWLFFFPLVVTAAITTLYLYFPASNRATAVLNTDATAVELALNRLPAENRSTVAAWYEMSASNEVVITAEAKDRQLAFATVEAIIGMLPKNEASPSMLSAGDSLELRAMRQYLPILESSVVLDGASKDTYQSLLVKETAAVQERIRQLALLDIPAKAVPLISKETTIAPTRAPPARNVAVFCFLASIFAVWMLIYRAEQHRINRLKPS